MDTNVCCLCLKDKCIKSMFADEESDVSEKIFILAGVAFNQHDGIPTGTCIDCIVKLEDVWKFRLQVQKSYASLKFVCNHPENDVDIDEMMIEMPHEAKVDVKLEILNFESETCSNFIPGHYTSQPLTTVDNKYDVNQSFIDGNVPMRDREAQLADEEGTTEKTIEGLKINLNDATDAPSDSNENFDCVLCGKVLMTKNEAVKHLIQHSRQTRAAKKSKVKSKIVKRTTTSSTEPLIPVLHGFDCDICGRCFGSKKEIVNHVLKDHGTEKKTFHCAYCDLKYRSQARCLWHISRSHVA
jgi:uncharacterized C2H2 Zn-finger protein